MNLYPKNKLPVTEVKKFILIFYSVGFLGFIIPWSRSFFVAITPFALLLSIYLLAIYHGKYAKKDIIVFLAIAILGFFIEVIGVNSGLIFGNYSYGNALGIKLFETPMLIAINWLFLTYTASTLSEKISNKLIIQILMAPSIMLLYDLILEQLAPLMNMWSWKDSVVPLKNYIAWWVIGFLFIGLIKVFRIETKNPLAFILFISQFVFFALLYLVFNLLI
jgi:putative membrane protein